MTVLKDAQNLPPIHYVDVEILHQISENFDVMVYPLETINVCVGYHSNSSNS